VKRIVAPTGSDDPFYFSIDDHYGSSDHEVFNDWGVQVPGIMMITWPDLYYHTSQDIADKCDPTQFKRVCFIGAAAAYTIASADESMALKIAGEVTGNASERMGKQLERAIDEMSSSTGENFEKRYKRSRGYIEAALLNEKATITTTSELVTGSPAYVPSLTKLTSSIDATGKALLASFDVFAASRAKSLSLPAIIFKPTPAEISAKAIVPTQTNLVTEKGYRGYSEYLTKLDQKIKDKYPIKNRRIDSQEIGRLCNGSNSVTDIKKLLDTQSREEYDLQDVLNSVWLLKEAGLLRF
jgi:hypothetical protein